MESALDAVSFLTDCTAMTERMVMEQAVALWG